MIDSVGKGGSGPIDLSRQEKAARVGSFKSDGARAPDGTVKSAVLDLVSGSAPVDSARVEAVRAAIQDGRYPIDPDRVARRMLDLDLPRRG